MVFAACGAKDDSSGGGDGDMSGDGDTPSESCNDETLNQDETDIDCGGTCDPCSLGEMCTDGDDCGTASCSGDRMGMGGYGGMGGTGNTNSVCLAASCRDGVLNGDETDIDCGGPCDPCDDLMMCNVPGDCTSGVCSNDSICAAPECGDGVVNGTDDCDSGPDIIGDGCAADCSLENALVNGGFESGDYVGWTLVEDSGDPTSGIFGIWEGRARRTTSTTQMTNSSTSTVPRSISNQRRGRTRASRSKTTLKTIGCRKRSHFQRGLRLFRGA